MSGEVGLFCVSTLIVKKKKYKNKEMWKDR